MRTQRSREPKLHVMIIITSSACITHVMQRYGVYFWGKMGDITTATSDSLPKLCFTSEDPNKLKNYCLGKQSDWEEEKRTSTSMVKFRKEMTRKYIFSSNSLEDTLPKTLQHKEAEAIWNSGTIDVDFRQLEQHLEAFNLLCGDTQLPTLTEELVKEAHKTMMCGLKNEQGIEINPGEYRTCEEYAGSVCSGYYHYPQPKVIPCRMTTIVQTYEDMVKMEHDPFKLASWLYFNVVKLHPFEDGNGRISRLLWCYSLMQDGLPFPVVLSSGHKRSQKHLLYYLKKDDQLSSKSYPPHITSLTVLSVNNAWHQYAQCNPDPD